MGELDRAKVWRLESSSVEDREKLVLWGPYAPPHSPPGVEGAKLLPKVGGQVDDMKGGRPKANSAKPPISSLGLNASS